MNPEMGNREADEGKRKPKERKGKKKGQILKQVWFSGCHSDVGGGYQAHDLSDITLAWMASSIEHILALDLDYLKGLPRPVAPWGQQPPHDSVTGIFKLAHTVPRKLPSPSSPEPPTFECIHPSVLQQTEVLPQVKALVKQNPNIVCQLQPLEEEIKKLWKYVPGQDVAAAVVRDMGLKKQEQGTWPRRSTSIISRVRTFMGLSVEVKRSGSKSHRRSASALENRKSEAYDKTWLNAVTRELK